MPSSPTRCRACSRNRACPSLCRRPRWTSRPGSRAPTRRPRPVRRWARDGPARTRSASPSRSLLPPARGP
ncbi:hypothetical protein F8566_09855 [Actinomadura rudentiformis]|uniref:Uncharacterized protein n=1 Tax=Actinomadura rudentiformis TaxID=359158 RepID=A0A6H9Z3U2_9ACTN|nr:hypothetical protein F8566_09855 [Actinomadura rudentiformis]